MIQASYAVMRQILFSILMGKSPYSEKDISQITVHTLEQILHV